MIYQFNTDDAKKYGINEAIILYNIRFWLLKNKANKKHEYKIEVEGTDELRTWTYNSTKAFSELFDFLTLKQIRTALDNLREAGVLITGNYNKSSYDRTLWYALKDESSIQNSPNDLPKKANGNAKKGTPIPDINTDNKQDNIIQEQQVILAPTDTEPTALISVKVGSVKTTDKKLIAYIREVFLSKNGNQFTNYAKEGAAINQIAHKIMKRFPDCIEEATKNILKKFWELKNSGNNFWASHPFLPSALNSAGIWDRVLETMKTNSGEDEARNLLKEMGLL